MRLHGLDTANNKTKMFTPQSFLLVHAKWLRPTPSPMLITNLRGNRIVCEGMQCEQCVVVR